MKVKFLNIIVLSVITLSSTFSNAGIITLDFEGVGNQAAIQDFYNGGTDSQGNSGEDYGISFGSDALACIDSDNGGGCGFANEPTAHTAMFFTSGSAVLNNAVGFDSSFSFYYSSTTSVAVDVYSGINLTGDLLGSINLGANWQDNSCGGDPTGAFCNWDIGSLNFAGVAHSIDFGGTANQVGFDNITFGAASPDSSVPVPEPSSLAIFGLALMGLRLRKFNK